MFSIKNVISSAIFTSAIICVAPVASAQEYAAGQQYLPQSATSQYGPGESSEGFLQLACVNCRNGQQTIAAEYLEKSIANLAERSRESGLQSKTAFNHAILELKHRAGQLRAGEKVTAKQLENGFSRATHAIGDTTGSVAHSIGQRSSQVLHATAGFGHDTAHDVKRDVQYLGKRTKLFGGRLAELAGSGVSAITRR